MGPTNDTKIEFVRTSKVFSSASASRGTIEAVKEFSMKIRENEFVSLIGPSGCGKSTILNMAAGFMAPTEGQILLDGKPIENPGKERGVIFQQYAIFPFLTVQKNIEFGLTLASNRVSPSERQKIASDLIRLMGLSGFRFLSKMFRMNVLSLRSKSTAPPP